MALGIAYTPVLGHDALLYIAAAAIVVYVVLHDNAAHDVILGAAMSVAGRSPDPVLATAASLFDTIMLCYMASEFWQQNCLGIVSRNKIGETCGVPILRDMGETIREESGESSAAPGKEGSG